VKQNNQNIHIILFMQNIMNKNAENKKTSAYLSKNHLTECSGCCIIKLIPNFESEGDF